MQRSRRRGSGPASNVRGGSALSWRVRANASVPVPLFRCRVSQVLRLRASERASLLPRPQRQRASLVSCHVSVRRGARHLHAAGAAGARQPGQRARDDIRRRVARRRGHGTRACSARRSAQRCAVFVWHVAQQARPTDTALTRTCAAQAMVLTGVCVFVIIMSGVKVVSSHGDRPWSFSRMRALARACASVAQSTGCEAAGHGQLSRITRSSARRVNLMRAPRRCMGGTRQEPAYGGVCRSMPKSHGSSRCTACRTHASVPPRALAARGSSSVRSCP